MNQSGNDTNTVLINNTNIEIDTITFVDPDHHNFTQNPHVFGNIGATSGPEIFDIIDPNADESVQITLTNNMLMDETEGGSLHSPEYLIDEQEKTFINGLKPTSQSWKPHYNMDKAPYSVSINLKQMYHLSTIGLFDMHNIKNLNVYYGEPGNWKPLFTEACDQYKTWKVHPVDVETQYIKLSMEESVYAAINEINVFGYPIVSQIPLTNTMITDHTTGGSLQSPLLLIDEQDSVALDNEHPVSLAWKPHYTNLTI